MRLTALKKGEKALIEKIESEGDLKTRLLSFGVTRGSEFQIENCSLGRKTIEIIVDDTYIGLRLDEAHKILVKRI